MYHYQLNNGYLGLYNRVRKLRSTIETFSFHTRSSDGLTFSACNWYIPEDFLWSTVSTDPESGPATDGDMDIAYGLILAANEFEAYANTKPAGSKAQRKALTEARRCKVLALGFIRGIAINYYGTATVNGQTRHYMQIAPSDWEEAMCLTRPSDWMPHHLETFINYYNAKGPGTNKSSYISKLQDLLNGTLAMIEDNKWGNGFFPDFIIFQNGTYRALTKEGKISDKSSDAYLFDQLDEGVVPNHLSWNACRAPWRFTEYTQLSSGSALHKARVKSVINKMLWYGFKPFNGMAAIASGYDSNWNIGTEPEESKYSTAFAAPGALTMMAMRVTCGGASRYKALVLKKNYEFLINKFKGHNDDEELDGYYEDSINAFSLLLMNNLMGRP